MVRQNRPMLRRLSFLPFTLAAGLAVAGQPAAPEGGSPICAWEITVTLLAYADTAASAKAVSGMTRWKIRRSLFAGSSSTIPISPRPIWPVPAQIFAQYRKLKANEVDLRDAESDIGTGAMYRHMMSDQSPAELRAWTDRFVSVPRDPAEVDACRK
jgi:hypothetical protein